MERKSGYVVAGVLIPTASTAMISGPTEQSRVTYRPGSDQVRDNPQPQNGEGARLDRPTDLLVAADEVIE
jgi:hypothetical protein